jgi:quinol monooxygenase YgiN
MTNNVYWILKCDIKDGQLDSFKTLAAEMSTATKEEEGAMTYEWHLSSDEKVVHIHERYTDSDATMVHLGNFGSKFAERFMGSVQPTSFEVYGQANDTVKGALADFGAVYFNQFAGFRK